jgi:hypothetical protein
MAATRTGVTIPYRSVGCRWCSRILVVQTVRFVDLPRLTANCAPGLPARAGICGWCAGPWHERPIRS